MYGRGGITKSKGGEGERDDGAEETGLSNVGDGEGVADGDGQGVT